jgi:hypothetical protein
MKTAMKSLMVLFAVLAAGADRRESLAGCLPRTPIGRGHPPGQNLDKWGSRKRSRLASH